MKKVIFRLISAVFYLVPSLAFADVFQSAFFQGPCPPDKTLACWVDSVFNWSLGIIGSIAVVVIAIGGVIYMTSGGNPDRVGQAKKLIFNALAGVAILILARFFLKQILGN